MRNHRIFKDTNIIFATKNGHAFRHGAREISEAGYTIFDMRKSFYNSPEEEGLLISKHPDLVIFDRLETNAGLVAGLREQDIKVVTFDDLGSGQQYANLAIHSLLQDVEGNARVKVGYDYLILPEMAYEPRRIQETVGNVFVCFGGYDNRNLTKKFLTIVPSIVTFPHYDIVVGRKPCDELTSLYRSVNELLEGQSIDIALHIQPVNFRQILHKSDLAIVAGGLTAFEAIQNGVPCIGVPQYVRQIENLTRLEQYGGLILFGNELELDRKEWADTVNGIILNNSVRMKMALAARKLIDGNGVHRVVNAIAKVMTP